ncbi:MAG: hypothetical protein WAN43_09930 [Rhodomicrobium sp.]
MNVTFKGMAGFDWVVFRESADFRGIAAERSFTLFGATFGRVPDFALTSFAVAVSLDNVRLPLIGRWSLGRDTSLGGKYRALQRLAIQGYDQKSEQLFFIGELRARRFVEEKPWDPEFWFGIIYEFYFGFTHSLLQPLIAWWLCIVVFALYFLAQNPDLQKEMHLNNILNQLTSYSTVALKLGSQTPPPCYAKTLPAGDIDKDSQNGFTGLVEYVRNSTNIVKEAFSLSYHNALVGSRPRWWCNSTVASRSLSALLMAL